MKLYRDEQFLRKSYEGKDKNMLKVIVKILGSVGITASAVFLACQVGDVRHKPGCGLPIYLTR